MAILRPSREASAPHVSAAFVAALVQLAPLVTTATPRIDWKDISVDDVRAAGSEVAPIFELHGENVHNVGALQLHVTNFGLLGALPGTNNPFSGAPSAQWPPGSGIEHLFGGGLWVGGLLNGIPRVSGLVHTRDRMLFEFRPGPTELDHIYHAHELTANGARLPAPNADDDGDGTQDEDPLDGYDNDGDGAIDEDFAASSAQMFTCVYRDDDPRIHLTEPDHVPLSIAVRQSTFAWEGEEARDFIGMEYTITNRGIDAIDSVYVGLYADFDIGRRDRPGVAQDDMTGFWEGRRHAAPNRSRRNVKVSIGYAYDDDADGGDAPGWIGVVFLGALQPHDDGIVRPVPIRNFRSFIGTATFATGGDPTTDDERYTLMAGGGPRALASPDSIDVRPAVRARRPGDYRTLTAAGPFGRLEPGESLTFAAAIVMGAGFDALIDNAVEAQLTYDGAWMNCDGDTLTGVKGREKPRCAPEAHGCIPLSICDTQCPHDCTNHACSVRVPPTGCVWQNADCDVEVLTGETTGVGGAECHIPWLGPTFPPVPPAMRVVGYEDRVEVYWDDRAEVTPDLRSGFTDFESYAVWRADGWDRPLGTSDRTGPAARLWSLLGEFDIRNGIGADTGIEALHYDPHVASELVQFYRAWRTEHPQTPSPDVPGHTSAECDTARALASGRTYHLFVDPPFMHGASDGGSCSALTPCAPIVVDGQSRPARCDERGRCRATLPPTHAGTHLFYAVTAADHRTSTNGYAIGPGTSGAPSGNFVYVRPPSTALPPERATSAESEIYAVPNPVTRESLAPWRLQPNNSDPTGVKVEFHHMPRSRGMLTIYTLAGDRVRELPFDATTGDGSVVWDLVSRNGQDVTSGVYLYTVEAQDPAFHRFVGKLVVIR